MQAGHAIELDPTMVSAASKSAFDVFSDDGPANGTGV